MIRGDEAAGGASTPTPEGVTPRTRAGKLRGLKKLFRESLEQHEKYRQWRLRPRAHRPGTHRFFLCHCQDRADSLNAGERKGSGHNTALPYALRGH